MRRKRSLNESKRHFPKMSAIKIFIARQWFPFFRWVKNKTSWYFKNFTTFLFIIFLSIFIIIIFLPFFFFTLNIFFHRVYCINCFTFDQIFLLPFYRLKFPFYYLKCDMDFQYLSHTKRTKSFCLLLLVTACFIFKRITFSSVSVFI